MCGWIGSIRTNLKLHKYTNVESSVHKALTLMSNEKVLWFGEKHTTMSETLKIWLCDSYIGTKQTEKLMSAVSILRGFKSSSAHTSLIVASLLLKDFDLDDVFHDLESSSNDKDLCLCLKGYQSFVEGDLDKSEKM